MMNEYETFNIIPFIVLSLANNSLLTNEIDRLYEKDKFKAYNVAKKSKFYNSPLFTDGSIRRQIQARRVLGIVELERIHHYNNSIIMTLFKSGWNAIYNYIEKTDIINVSYISNKFIKYDKGEDYIIGAKIATIIIAGEFDKDIRNEDGTNYVLDVLELLNSIYNHYERKDRFSYNNIKNDKVNIKKAIDIKDRFNEILSDDLRTTMNLTPAIIKDENIMLHSNSCLLLFDAEFVDFNSITDNMKIFDKDIIELSYLYYLDNKDMNRENSAKFIVSGLYIKCLIKAYKELKEYYFKNNKETLFLELEKLINHNNLLEENNKSLKSQLVAIKNENGRLKKEYKDSIEKKNILLEKEIEKLYKKVKLLENEKNELKELSESIFNKPEIKNDIIISNNEVIIPKIKCIIAGGHSSWHNKIKGVLPDSFIFIEGDNERFDDQILDNREIVFLYTKYMSHSFFYKLKERCKKQNIKTYYISSSSPGNLKKEISNLINSSI